MDKQFEKVQALEDEINNIEKTLYEKKQILEVEMNLLKKICTHRNFIKEDNGDCHNPGYYYTCSTCGFWHK